MTAPLRFLAAAALLLPAVGRPESELRPVSIRCIPLAYDPVRVETGR